jgi:hypothetical protein
MSVDLEFVLLEKPGRLLSSDAVETLVDDELGSALRSDESELTLVELLCPVELPGFAPSDA